MKTTVEIEDDLKKVIEHICIDREITFKEALDRALRKWVSDQDEC